MEVENNQLPADKQDIDKIPNYDFYIRYLSDSVEAGALSEEEASEIIEGGQWQKVIDLIDEGDFYANSQEEDEEPLRN